MYPLILKPQAIWMARDAYQWYEMQSKGLGEHFLAELESSLKKIQTTPTANGKVNKNYRQGKLLRFPYVIVYEIIRTEIIVFSIFHTKRNPGQKFA